MNPYELLQIPMNAAPDQIMAAFRRVTEAAHPDLHPGDPNAAGWFYAIVDAYNILCDPVSRYELDTRLMSGERGYTYRSEDFRHSEGFQKYSADELLYVISSIRAKEEEAKTAARKYALSGLAWFVGGLAVTIISAMAGVGVLAWGAILFGGIEAVRGLAEYFKVGGRTAKVKDQFWFDYLNRSVTANTMPSAQQ